MAGRSEGNKSMDDEISQDLVDRITTALAHQFPSFGAKREQTGLYNVTPVSAAFADGPPVFALGVNIEAVVRAVLRWQDPYG